MNPDSIELENLSKSFEYFIDSIENIDDAKNIAKCCFKLHLKQQEVMLKLITSKP